MNFKEEEEKFLTVLEELIETFSKHQLPEESNNKTISDLATTLRLMFTNEEVAATVTDSKNVKLDMKFSTFMEHVEVTRFYQEIIPYDKITECVFEKTPTEILYSFTSELRTRGEYYFDSKKIEPIDQKTLDEEKTFLKIIRHIDLALIQKNSFANIKLKEMDALKENHRQLDERYKALKHEADNQYKNMLTQYISILGVFAAILMGSFGAIQGFSNIFANADKLPLGKILIISSIGGSSVILIIFFLLNGIAKLTNRSLSSSNRMNASILEKHPTIVISHGILIFISLIGAALSLSDIKLYFAWQGLWWALPLFWLWYFITATYKRDPFFIFSFIKHFFVNITKSNAETIEDSSTSSETNKKQQS